MKIKIWIYKILVSIITYLDGKSISFHQSNNKYLFDICVDARTSVMDIAFPLFVEIYGKDDHYEL